MMTGSVQWEENLPKEYIIQLQVLFEHKIKGYLARDKNPIKQSIFKCRISDKSRDGLSNSAQVIRRGEIGWEIPPS